MQSFEPNDSYQLGHPAVTIVTPTKNRLPLICEAIDSVQAQDFAAWEHIIVDDGSDDNSAEEIQRRSQSDPRIRFFRRMRDKTGANVCRNIGIRESKADLIVFLDSDDLLRPHCIGQRVKVMQRNLDIDFATFGTAVFEKMRGDLGNRVDNDLLGDDLTRFLCFECPWIITGPIWRKRALLRIGCLDESLISWQDIDLHIRAIANDLKYLRFSDIDHDIRWQFEPGKVSVKQWSSMRHLEAAVSMFAKFEKTVRDAVGMNWNRQRGLCGLYFLTAEMMLGTGTRINALRCWKQVKQRRLANYSVYLQGVLLLALMSFGPFGYHIGRRLSHKWKGMVRFRTQPESVGS